MQNQTIHNFAQGGLDNDSAPEFVAANDFTDAYNCRSTGTSEEEAGYVTNLESTIEITLDELAGINKGIGGRAFENIRQIVFFRYNSFGTNQICVYDYDTNTARVIYTDKTDSAGQTLLPLDPKNIVKCILINDTYLVWADGSAEVGYTNLKTLSAGGYGSTVLEEDFSLIKPQPLVPITATYANDMGKAANFLKGKLFQFIYQWVNADFNYSTWATWSKRIIPPQESTPTVGTSVSSNNCIVVSVPIGSIRASQLNVACRYGTNIYNIVKTVDRAYITALTNTAVDVSNAIYEAYNPTTGIYQFAFYNENLTIAVPPTQTDQFIDYIWPATGIEKINGNIIALGDLKVGYERPTTDVSLQAVGYDPNLTVPNTDTSNPLVANVTYAGGEGSGSKKYLRRMTVNYKGSPKTGDVLNITNYNTQNAAFTQQFNYTVPSGLNNNLLGVVNAFAATIPNSSVFAEAGGYTIQFFSDPLPHIKIQSATVTLFNAGSPISKSIHAILDNSSYQLALSYRDKFGRPFPLETDNNFIVPTPSFAQLNGQTPRITWAINNPVAPIGAVDYQWLITKNTTTTNILDVFGCLINYIGSWDAHGNTPPLSPNQSGSKVGDAYQISVPSLASDNRNLGNGQQVFNTGDYVVYNGKSWDIVAKSFGDLTANGNILAIKINPLYLFNQRYTNSGIETVLNYDYSTGDRCTLHYYVNQATPTLKFYLNTPCIDVDVFGYDPATSLLKVQKSSSLITANLVGKDIYLRLYSPNTQLTGSDATTENTTVWYEIGERFTITNGLHDVVTGLITDGDVYFKTRSYQGAIDPNFAYDVFATDFNFSDFYPSRFTSYGRPRSYYDVLEKTEQKASIIYSQNYILGSRKNGLNRFYPENIYGEGDGQTSSSFGAIMIMWQRNNTLVIVQELNVGYIPVNRNIIEDLAEQQQIAISEKLLNTITYNQTGEFGIGKLKESFCYNNATGYFIDPQKSEPMAITLQGIVPISGKMSKYFKATLQLAYAQGKKIVMFYNVYYDELNMCIQTDGGTLTLFKFDAVSWQPLEIYNIAPADITATSTPANTTKSFDASTGLITYTPTTGFVGNAVGTFTFNTTGGAVTKNVCLTWTPGSSTVFQFMFINQDNQPLNTYIVSNSIVVQGNDIAVPISITGGQYSINGGAYTSAAGTVNPLDAVTVRVMSAATPNTNATTTLTISATTGSFTAKTYPQQFFTYQVVEQGGTGQTYSDANLQIKINGTPTTFNGTTSGSLPVLPGDLVTLEAFGELPSTGISPTIDLTYKKDGAVVFNNTITNNPPPTTSIVYPTSGAITIEFGHTYDVKTQSSASGAPGYSVVNRTTFGVVYNVYDNVGGLLSTGTLANGSPLNIQALLLVGSNYEVRFVAPTTGTYPYQEIPTGTVGSFGLKSSGAVVVSYTSADIATQVGLGYQGRVLNQPT